MSKPPELTSKEAKQDLFDAAMRATGVVLVEIRGRNVDAANRWLMMHWDLYFTPEQQEKILIEFTMYRLTK